MPSIQERHLARFRADPSDRRAFEALEESYFVAGDWRGLLSLYEVRLEAPDLRAAPRERARVLFRLGQVHAERRGDPDRACDYYRQAVAADASYRPPLTELRQIAVERAQWVVAVQIAEAEAALEMPPGERAELLAQLGSIWLDHLLEPEAALEQFERALERDPTQAQALAGAARATHELGRSGEAARFWGRCAAVCQGREKARALVAQAGLLAGVLGAQERATQIYEEALAADPDNADAVDALAALAEVAQRWTRLAELQERRFQLCTDPERRAAIALSTGRLHLDQLLAPEAARPWLERALEIDASDPAVLRAMAHLERECGDDAALCRVLEQMVALSGDRVPVANLLELATLHADANNDERALAVLSHALSQAPDDGLVIEALSETLTRLGRHEERVDILERRAALTATDPPTCASVLAELGALHEEQLDDPEAARQAYERAMSADPSTPGVARALERIYRKTEAWHALRGLLDQVSRGGDTEERRSSLCALGELLVERFDDAGAATRAFEAALDLDPTCVAAHRGLQRLAVASGDDQRILEVFEREASVTTERARLATLVQELARIHAQRGEAETALEWTQRWILAAPAEAAPLRVAAGLLEQLGRDPELLETLERLDPLLQSHAQAENRRRIAALHLRNGRREEAVTAHRAALDLDPTDVESLRALDAAYAAEGRSAELAAIRRRLAELVPESERATCLDGLARLLEEALGDPSGAIDALAELVDCPGAPGDAEARLEALLDRCGRYEELAARLEQRARDLDPASESARDLHGRRARVLLERLSRFDDAAAIYRHVLSLHPGCDEARSGLERSLRAAGDHAGLAEYLAQCAAAEPDPELRDRHSLERAVLLEEALDDPAGAVEVYRRLSVAAAGAEERIQASARLEVLLERAADWPELRAHLERVLETLEGRERLPLLERLARLCRDRLHDAAAAARHFEEAAALAPERPDIWRALTHLYENAGRGRELVHALEQDLATNADPEREVHLRRRIATLYAEELDEADRAAPHFERVLELEPGDSSAAEFLSHRFEAQQRPAEVVRVLERRLGALDAMPRDSAGDWAAQRTSLRLRIASLRSGPLDDPDGAIAVLEPALGEVGTQSAIAEPLASLYRRTGYLDELIELCQRAAAESPTGAERSGWYARLGGALRERGSDAEAAEAWRQVLVERPGDDAATSALRELYRRLGEAEPLVRLLEAELDNLAGPPEVPVRMELAKLCAGALRRPADALAHLRRVVHVDPGHAAALTRALELAEELERSEVVLELLDVALARPQAPSQRASLLTRRARVLASRPEQLDEAVAAYREAVRLDPARRDVREALRRLLEATGRHVDVLDCLLAEAERADPDTRPDLYEQAADLAWQQLSPEAALPWLERLRRVRPRHLAVVMRIAEVHRLAGRPADLVRTLERLTTLAPDAMSKRDFAVERAHVLESELHAPGRALRALEEARALCPEDAEVLESLDRLYRGLGRHEERVEVLETLVETSPGLDRVSLLCEAAALCSGPLAEPERAAELLQRAIDETPRSSPLHVELRRTLGEALRSAGDEDGWARCAEAELAALEPSVVFDDRRFELHRELALAYSQAGRLDDSLLHLRRLIDSAPAAFDPTGSLEEALLRGLRAQGNPVELERRLGAWLEHHPGDADAWLELARLREETLCAIGSAAEAFRQALAVEPECLEAIRGLRSAAERLGNWDEMAAMLEREVECAPALSAEARAGLLRRLGDVAWKKLGSTTRASRTYAAALEANPEDFAAQRAFEELLESVEDWRGAADLYESEVEVLGERDPARRQRVWLRVGEIARDHLGEMERALRAFVSAAAVAPLNLARRRELAELHLRCGEREAFAEVFAAWCDEPAAGANAYDELRLADTLEQLDRREQALARVDRALELDPSRVEAWELAARLREASGDAAGASAALEKAAELAADGNAAGRLLAAARLSAGEGALEASLELLRRAVAADPGRAGAQAELALAALDAGSAEEAEEAAALALELDAGGDLDADRRLSVALAGARAARQLERLEAAARFYAAALELHIRHPEALAGAGETLCALGDLERARKALTDRLALDEPDPQRALHHALLARCLAAADPDAALAHCCAALDADPKQLDAHALRADLLEASGRANQGIEALESWAAAVAPGQRAWILERAAEWELEQGELEAAERHLRDALADAPSLASAWLLLSELLRERECDEELVEVTRRALDHVEEPEPRCQLALLRGAALERSHARGPAADAYALAAEADPGCFEAAAARARLLRALGDWRAAADTLERFIEVRPGADPEAEACMQLGRLRAGPLEDVAGAVQVYRRAVELRPQDLDLRATLAELLSHRPDDRREALAHYREVLELDPLHLPALRAALRAALESGSGTASGDGLLLLRALGVATPQEAAAAPERLVLQLAAGGGLDDPLSETLRQAVQSVAREIGAALAAPEAPVATAGEDAMAAFRAAALEAEAGLTAPGLLPLPTEELRALLTCIAALALDSDEAPGSGSTLNAVAAELGRRARRRVRRLLEGRSFQEIQAVDFAAWRREVRVLAAACAVDQSGCDLRTALVALVCESADRSHAEISPTANLTPLVAACPEALGLMRRAVRAWLAEVVNA